MLFTSVRNLLNNFRDPHKCAQRYHVDFAQTPFLISFPVIFQTLLLLLAIPPSSHGQRTLFARLFNRVYSLFSNFIGGERLCPAGSGLIDLATLIPCGAELPACPANLACQPVTTLCRNTLIEVTVSLACSEPL